MERRDQVAHGKRILCCAQRPRRSILTTEEERVGEEKEERVGRDAGENEGERKDL